MKICILGLGVIGTTYANILKNGNNEVYHLIREEKQSTIDREISVHLLDGRYSRKGEEKVQTYHVDFAESSTNYDFILVSVSSGKLKEAIETIKSKEITGTIIVFCNLWETHESIAQIIDSHPYILAFPTAGGEISNSKLNCVLFDHIMLEDKSNCNIPNYNDLINLLDGSDIKVEVPYKMIEWIWIHMAINAAVTSTAGRSGHLDNPKKLAEELMNDSRALGLTVKTIRETLKVVEARGVNLRYYKNEILPYKLPSMLAGFLMKQMFASNELTRRIMTLHSDINDMLYGCNSIYEEGKKQNLKLPLFYKNMDQISKVIS